jgi:hypothetical protein
MANEYSPYDSLNKYRDLINKQYSVMGEGVKKKGAELSAQQVSATGRGVARAGVTGPLAEASKRQAALDVNKQITDQLDKLDTAKLDEEKELTLKEAEIKQQEEQANQQLLYSIFGGIGSFIKDYTPVGPALKAATGNLFGYNVNDEGTFVKK